YSSRCARSARTRRASTRRSANNYFRRTTCCTHYSTPRSASARSQMSSAVAHHLKNIP
uniref:Uncharacterized protein LOC113795377 n=1 Tax=Dermatophagoides pteronyssinus TaxID=6956 RepID=A0A6P6Y7J1_DERPT